MTIKELLDFGVLKLKEVKAPKSPELFDSPEIDCRVILCYVMDVNSAFIFANFDFEVSEDVRLKFITLLDKRISGMPIAYIIGKREFYGYDFFVNEDVLIPRADTESMVEKAIEIIDKFEVKSVLDLCCGSGCIAASIKLERPDISVTASDISEKALKVAKKNFLNLGCEITTIKSNLFDLIDSSFDMIITNPPYIPLSEYNFLSTNLFEPELALFADKNGLAFIEKIVLNSIMRLNNRGHILIESMSEQTELVRELLIKQKFNSAEIFCDLSGKKRFTYGFFVK